MGVEWTPGKLVYTIDDQVWGTVQSIYVPNISMGLALQTQAGTTSSNWNPIPNNSTPSMVEMQVDWVVIYAWNPQQTLSVNFGDTVHRNNAIKLYFIFLIATYTAKFV